MSTFVPMSESDVRMSIELSFNAGHATLSVHEYRSLCYYLCEDVPSFALGTELHQAMVNARDNVSTQHDHEVIDSAMHDALRNMRIANALGIEVDEWDLAVAIVTHNSNLAIAGDLLDGLYLRVTHDESDGSIVVSSDPVSSDDTRRASRQGGMFDSSDDVYESDDPWTADDDRAWQEYLSQFEVESFEWDDSDDDDTPDELRGN